MSIGTSAPARPHRRWSPPGLRRALPVVGWLLPALVVIGFVIGYPVIQVIIDSFSSKTRFSPGEFVGLDNFRELMAGGDQDLFWLSFRNNLVLLVSIPVTILVGLVVSSVLYRGIRGSRLYEVFIFLPFLPAVAAISVIFIYLLGWQGPLNETVRALSLEPLAQAWLTDPGWPSGRFSAWSHGSASVSWCCSSWPGCSVSTPTSSTPRPWTGRPGHRQFAMWWCRR